MQKQIIAKCKTCGMIAKFMTTAKKISEGDKILTCNNCMWKEWQKKWNQPKLKQAVLF